MRVEDFGLVAYGTILNLQEEKFNRLIEDKKRGIAGEECVLIGEHKDVVTLGRRAKEENILLPLVYLKQKGIEVFRIGRGGDVTFHNPGQLIVYPILDLDRHKLGVKDYVSLLEESVLRLLAVYGIKGERIEGATGVWIGKGTENERKICAIGVKCSHFCTMHGLALNVDNDLSGFGLINPCGFKDKGVTSMRLEIEKSDSTYFKSEESQSNVSDAGFKRLKPDMEKIKKEFLHIFFSLIFPFEEVFHLSE